ncbi:MAG: phosphatidylinositol mannoside acyltransferase [Actinomycetia bacterium]|nr:phosphatidylinositol mannoside acyltransferase [Actinomycetes bacterium]MCP3912032.1 phosphatidylinositol mannoside acyltransferase [Actinomycetes bacterium]MCP4086747.1 phosphatidylinositol mannoside acyltransferase [Actinomycetes bacterium]
MGSRAHALYRTGGTLARHAPSALVDLVARTGGFGAAQVTPDKRRQVERNLGRIYPTIRGQRLRRGVDACFDSYARYWADTLRLPSVDDDELDEGLTYEGYEHIVKARADGKGPLMIVPHLGSWEWAAFWLTRLENVPVSAVVEAIEPADVFDWFVELRESLGLSVIPLGPNAAKDVAAAVKRGEVTCLVADRDISGTGIEVEFFGERTSLPAGPAALALRTGAPLLPTAVYYRGSRRHCVVHPPMEIERQGRLREDVARITQDVAHRLEDMIRVAPEQWHLLQPNWPSDHEAERACRTR